LVLDLRGVGEIARDGEDAVGTDVEVRLRSMDPVAGLAGADHAGEGASSADTADLVRRLVDSPDVTGTVRAMMIGVYDSFVTNAGIRGTVGQVLTDVADADGPVVVHCSAGKDRTGWIVALVQYVCGIGSADRMAEYLVSAAAAPIMAASVPPIPGLSAEALMPLWSVEPGYLTGAWERAVEDFGSVDEYLLACGVDAPLRDRLRARFLA
jgi:protein-tyrosine phosphatase